MKFVPFILKHLRRNWVRTSTTVAAMTVCIFLFCTLQTVVRAVTWNLQSANASRLVTRHKVSLAFFLPLSYQPRMQAIPGVQTVIAANWFGGVFRDFRNFFQNLAVEPEAFLKLYPEYLLPEDQKQAWFQDRRGCIIGRKLANRFHWKVGDTFAMESFIPPYRIGKPFEFVVRGIYDTDQQRYPGTDGSLMFFHFNYLYEATNHRSNVGLYYVGLTDPRLAGSVSKAIDDLFENSDFQTRTETESAFRAGFLAMAGNLALLLNFIGLAVSFTILLVVANTMSMAVRERRTEIAVLKTLGFSSALVTALILGESIALGALGGGLGILLGRFVITALPEVPFVGDAVRGFPDLGLDARTAAMGMGVGLFLGLAAGFVPALLTYRARITDMLRQV